MLCIKACKWRQHLVWLDIKDPSMPYDYVLMSLRCRMPPDSDAPDASAATPPATAASQGKPSLRRIKGRIHKSKSLDSIDLLDCNVSRYSACRDDVIQSLVFHRQRENTYWACAERVISIAWLYWEEISYSCLYHSCFFIFWCVYLILMLWCRSNA